MAPKERNTGESDELLEQAVELLSNSKSGPSSLNGTTAPTSEDENMDYDSDEYDDAKSNHSNSNQSGGQRKRGPKGEGKRFHHNVLERKRRDLIKDSFSKLKDAVPTLGNDRASRAQILKQAADFIQHTLRRNEENKAEIAKLERENQRLEMENETTS